MVEDKVLALLWYMARAARRRSSATLRVFATSIVAAWIGLESSFSGERFSGVSSRGASTECGSTLSLSVLSKEGVERAPKSSDSSLASDETVEPPRTDEDD